MNLDILKSRVHISRWGEGAGSTSLSFDVVPEGRGHIEIGEKYLFAASSYSRIFSKDRDLIGASVSITSDPDVLANIKPLFPDEKRSICGWASFYKERQSSLEYDAPQLIFTIVVTPDQFQEMLRAVQSGAGGSFNIGIEQLKFGWEPDASHLIWELDEGDDKRPISTFSYSAERFWTSEGAIRDERDRKLNAELADSPDPEARKLAALSAADRPLDPTVALLKECRALLVALVVLGALVLFKVS